MSVSSDVSFAGPGPDVVYEGHLKDGRFMIQRCQGCGAHIFYPRLLCPTCGHPELDWVTASGDGTVYAVTIPRPRGATGAPHNVVLVDLAEGPRMMGRVDGLAAEEVEIGMKVTARIDSDDDGPLVVFDPA